MPVRRRPLGVGFLLAQLGAHSSAAFATAIQPLGVTPPHVGLLRAISEEPGRSQQSIADQFGMLPSRMVVLLDELEQRGLVERRRDPADRRVHLVHPTDAGQRLMAELAGVMQAAEQRLLAPLPAAQRRELADLLGRLVDGHGLTPGVHPGYRMLRLRDEHAGREGRTDC